MNDLSSTAALPAAPFPPALSVDSARAVFAAAGLLLPDLERGRPVDAAALRAAMEAAFGASDASGAWDWKTAYDACEAATVLFLRKYGSALFRKAGSPAATLPLLAKIAGLLPTHTRRSEESETLQQFSTPIPLGVAASVAAAITPADRRAGAIGRHRPARHFCRTRGRQADPQRTGRDARRNCSPPSFRPSPSRGSTPRRSTIISTPASCRASC